MLAGDDAADFAGLGLYLHGIGFDGYTFLRAPDLQRQIDTRTFADVEYDVLLFVGFEALGFAANCVGTNRQISRYILAAIAGLDVGTALVPVLVMVMVTLGTAAPVGSVTVPKIVPPVPV